MKTIRDREIQKNMREGCMMCITVNPEVQRISKDDVKTVMMMMMMSGKTVGANNIPAETWNYLGVMGVKH